MIKIFKYFVLVFVLLNFNYQVQAKPVPPGSGEGDVPANILLLLDSSASMDRTIGGEEPLRAVPVAIKDSNGDYIVSQGDPNTFVKFNADQTRDKEFNSDAGRFTGDLNHACTAVFDGTGTGYTTATKDTRVMYTVLTRLAEGVTTDDGKISNQNVLFFRSGSPIYQDQAVMGVSEDGQTCLFYIRMGFLPQSFDYQKIGDEHFLFVSGQSGRKGAFASFNLNTGERSAVQSWRRGDGQKFRRNWRSTVNNDGSIYYIGKTHIYGYSLEKSGNTYSVSSGTAARKYTSVNRPDLDTQLAKVTDLDISPDDSDIMYIVSQPANAIQKVQLDTATSYTILERAGTYNRSYHNLESAGTLAANSVRFYKPYGIHVTSDTILVGSRVGTVDIFNEDLFTSANVDTAWRGQFGGGKVTRWLGLKKAISGIVSDTTLTGGAHFGYGHWNAGQHGGGRDTAFGGRRCHRNQDVCSYYGSWDIPPRPDGTAGEHKDGRSAQCNNDSCLDVAISAEGYTKILDSLLPQITAWGTDGRAFSQMARHYFLEDFDGYEEDSECQLNYVIVIGDGEINNYDKPDALPFIEELRDKTNPIKTLFVGYGGGISDRGKDKFAELAIAGSCPGGDSSHADCHPVIYADTPEELKTQLTAVIRQILAERLSFTAPSITATVQEGGSLYQAQFAYEQYGEWQGTILRKTLNEDGTVIHEVSEPGNWDAAVEIKKQASAAGMTDTRKIWSAIPDVPYLENWDNFNIDNSDAISEIFGILDYEVEDYHNETSSCVAVGDNGNEDDIDGLINFMKGTDYFDYNGDCNINELRTHVLGDIYHSQLIEIGPPDANTTFTDANEEAYFRSVNNYQAFQAIHASRRDVIYAGSNSGILHAINAETGAEEWGFIPPFIAGLLPTVINTNLDGKVDGSTRGGSNAIFGVDGSPVVHDVFIRGYDQEGELEETKNWHTILMIPYGRGGAGFSVLDVTNPTLEDGLGPIHMFSIYNDAVNNRVLVSDSEGNIQTHTYSSGSMSISDTKEGIAASRNLSTALDSDGGIDTDITTAQDAIATCQTNADAGGTFHATGTASCFKGTKFIFEGLNPEAPDGINVPETSLRVTERINGQMHVIDIASAKYVDGQFVIEFNEEKVFNPGGSTLETAVTTSFNVATSCTTSSGIEEIYDYSQLGETWSAPRIARIPSPELAKRSNSDFDAYVAIMGGGMGNTNLCAGSAVFIVNLEDNENPGSIYGAAVNGGPITIIDTEKSGISVGATTVATPNASDIGNSLPASAVVITPDTAYNIPWRGAMVYFNDLEGKITKINLTSSTKNDASLFDQTTLFRLNADTDNKRYSYFSMDAGIGLTTNDFWLFGGTGNFSDIGGGSKNMDNILYGIKDPHYPYFTHLNEVHIPNEKDATFLALAHQGANTALSVDDAAVCADTTGKLLCTDGPGPLDLAWVTHLDEVDGLSPKDPLTVNTFRKLSAAPTLFRGQVYFPIYEPPIGTDKCNIGNAYICVADDECGINNSHLLTRNGAANGKACKFVREGILSELVIFGDKLFANVAGPKEDARTLYQILAAAGEVSTNKGNWRESGF